MIMERPNEDRAGGPAGAADANRFLAEATALLTTTLDYETRLTTLANMVVPRLGDFCIVDIRDEEGRVRRIEVAHANAGREALARELLRFPPMAELSEGVPRVLRSGRSLLLEEIDDEIRADLAQSEEHERIILQLDARHALTVPIAVHERPIGAITFVSSAAVNPYGPAEVELAEEIGRRAGIALDNAMLYRRAQQAIRAREEVLSVVSHELRNPVNAAVLTLEMVLEGANGDLLPAQETRLRTVHRLTEQMVRQLDDLMDVKLLEAGQLPIRPQEVDAAGLVAHALAAVAAQAEMAGVEISADIPDSLPALRVDRLRTMQVFGNLLTNALRHVPRGGRVCVQALRLGGEVQFSVVDSGPGITDETLITMLRDPRPASRGSASGGSLGMGLAIASGIVRAHGGEFWAESGHISGCTFCFTLPIGEPSSARADEGERIRLMESIPLFAAPGARRAAARSTPERAAKRRGRTQPELIEPTTPTTAGAAAATLRQRITAAVHQGHLSPGDRLPSIRQVASGFGLSKHAAERALDLLAAEGLIEKRDRSGMYVAELADQPHELAVETAEWLAQVLTEASEHQVRAPMLPGLLQRWALGARLRCACVESDDDSRLSLCHEYERQFGIECVPVDVADIAPGAQPSELPEELRTADFVLTTAFHAGVLRDAAARLGKPMVVATADPATVELVEGRIADQGVTLVCADPRFGERMRSLRGPELASRVRVTLADDHRAVEALDPEEPLLMTLAARERIPDASVRLLAPRYPAYSRDTVADIARLVVEMNLAAERRIVPTAH